MGSDRDKYKGIFSDDRVFDEFIGYMITHPEEDTFGKRNRQGELYSGLKSRSGAGSLSDWDLRDELTDEELSQADEFSLTIDDYSSAEEFRDALEEAKTEWRYGISYEDEELAAENDIFPDDYDTEDEFNDALDEIKQDKNN